MIVSIKNIKSYKLLKRLDKHGTASAKTCMLKKTGVLQEQVQSALRKAMCLFVHVALQM